ncbi:M28 family peptidase [Helicobacter sp. 11S03491-1]|uniref:M28 family peptidase n=1 Tax=Helicobacter sp. 11S03491-1 TaxID=1476196 RepID=UPI000BA5289C|nr:M28 family peptidase [Helicobacter sp. 11S03491-1]PAF42911.1 hypothetical protein BKH45_02245 [Helicobacter sp. 11S03491-1]
MKSVLEIFEEIAHIPHASFHTHELFEWICEFAKSCDYEIQSDKAKNIYAFCDQARLCFQSHYDMVGVGQADKGMPLQLYTEGNFLKAKNSSLGADNGIGVAIQLYLMQKYRDLEFLFTNNEEVGLLGAKELEIGIHSNKLINLDSEKFGEIVLGCAGGYDMNIIFDIPLDKASYLYAYNITSRGFCGGHSGIDIHKNIKNAILRLAGMLAPIDGGIYAFCGGEKINSIPVNVKVIFHTNEILESCDEFLVEKIPMQTPCYCKNQVIKFLLEARSGVRFMEKTEVIDSLNISLIEQENEQIKISLMGRSNTKILLENNLLEMQNLAKKICKNPQINVDDYYSPWERNIKENDAFLKRIKNAFSPYCPKICQIHAGLECGILQERFEKMGKKDVKIFSIGPTILSPHSLNERLDLDDFEKFFQALEILIENYKI